MLRLAVAENQRQNFAAIALHPIGAGLSLTERNHAGGDKFLAKWNVLPCPGRCIILVKQPHPLKSQLLVGVRVRALPRY